MVADSLLDTDSFIKLVQNVANRKRDMIKHVRSNLEEQIKWFAEAAINVTFNFSLSWIQFSAAENTQNWTNEGAWSTIE